MLRSIPTQTTNFCITKIDVPKVRPKGEGYLPESKEALECKAESVDFSVNPFSHKESASVKEASGFIQRYRLLLVLLHL